MMKSVTEMNAAERTDSIIRMIMQDPGRFIKLLEGQNTPRRSRPRSQKEHSKVYHRTWTKLSDADFELFWALRNRIVAEKKSLGLNWREFSQQCKAFRDLSKVITPDRGRREEGQISIMRAALRRLGVHNV